MKKLNEERQHKVQEDGVGYSTNGDYSNKDFAHGPTVSWSTEKRKLKELVPHPRNPRYISKKDYNDLKQSLSKFNYVEVVAINTDNRILAGHMRVKALEEIHGHDYEIEVRVPSRLLTDREALEYLIRSNKNTGDWDEDLLANDFAIDDLVLWGFSSEELEIEQPLEESNEHEETSEEQTKCPQCGYKFIPH